MQSIAEDPLIVILEYCDLSICALVNKRMLLISNYIQMHCDGKSCRFKHPICMLNRPYDVAVMATKYDYTYPLQWILRNNKCDLNNLRRFCMDRWDLYRNVYKFLTNKNRIYPAIPQTDREFVEACHQGRHIIPPFNMTVGSLPLRGMAASHALKNYSDVKFITFAARASRLFGVVRYRVDISRYFHEHDLDAIKALTENLTKKTPIYINSLANHMHICESPHGCNCLEICEWIIKNKTLEDGCKYQYGMLKYHLRQLGLQS